MKSKHLIVVSVDALVFEDLEYAKTLPMFGRILREGSVVERVKTIYPSLTHPVHASLLTGCPAGVTESFPIPILHRAIWNPPGITVWKKSDVKPFSTPQKGPDLAPHPADGRSLQMAETVLIIWFRKFCLPIWPAMKIIRFRLTSIPAPVNVCWILSRKR